ncbi:hypothetical protein K0M31_018963 [Melipona bicolor]|uniref:Uncharacterized protein n=1 Tax=Melipona bicolor TaxID=60889 RepID=A0AA40FCK4_9HYME|nr:hypothetical protein K0M31_018963 [Melipona bicolor]
MVQRIGKTYILHGELKADALTVHVRVFSDGYRGWVERANSRGKFRAQNLASPSSRSAEEGWVGEAVENNSPREAITGLTRGGTGTPGRSSPSRNRKVTVRSFCSSQAS